MKWLVVVGIAVLLYYLLLRRPGRLSFWKLASRYPDAAFDHFVSAPCWKVFEQELPASYREIVPSSEWDGPFRLWVPKLGGGMIYVFGKRSEYESSQDQFIQEIQVSERRPN
jgi:hypothetical protein